MYIPVLCQCIDLFVFYVCVYDPICYSSYIYLQYIHNCSAYNVGLPQFRLLQKEIQRGLNIIVRGVAPVSIPTPTPMPTMHTAHNPHNPLPSVQSAQSVESTSAPPQLQVPNLTTDEDEDRLPPRNRWELLFAPATTEFFQRHCRYIQIDISANSALQQRVWFGWCESRLRLLTASLEQVCIYIYIYLYIYDMYMYMCNMTTHTPPTPNPDPIPL